MTSRRDVLKLLAAGGLLPLVASHTRTLRADTPTPTRLVLLMQGNGTSQKAFWPDASMTSSILEPILSVPRLRERTTIVRGLENTAGGAGNGHDQGFAGLYSGVRSEGAFDDPWGMGPSLDQMVRGVLQPTVPFPTLNAGVLASDIPPLKAHRRSFSYQGARRQIPTSTDPVRLYAQLFGASVEGAERALAKLAEDRSVLDYAARDLSSLSQRLSRAEREKLEIHATSVRELERRLSVMAARPAAQGRCAPAKPQALGQREADVPALMDTMFELAAVALGCGLTQVLTFPMGYSGTKWRFDWLGIGRDFHDQLAHRDDGGGDVTALLVRVNRWYAGHVARFAQMLDSFPEGQGTMLDHTLIVWGNELATGPHGLKDIPVVLLGGASGRLLPGPRLVSEGPQTYHRLGCSLLRVMGIEAQGFGEERDCGPVRGLFLGS